MRSIAHGPHLAGVTLCVPANENAEGIDRRSHSIDGAGRGANTLIFSFVDALLLRPLAVRDPTNLFLVTKNRKQQVRPDIYLHYAEYQALSRATHLFESVSAEALLPYEGTYPLSLGGESKLISVKAVTGNFFADLGVRAFRGRVFAVEDDAGRGAVPALVSYRFWKGALGSDPEVVGRTIRLKDHPLSVVGVLRRDFSGVDLDSGPDLYVPASAFPLLAGRPLTGAIVNIYVRLRPGVTKAQLTAEAGRITRQAERTLISNEQPPPSAADLQWMLDYQAGFRSMEHGSSQLRDLFSHGLKLLMGAVILLLVIVCANLASLLLARVETRRREIAVRLAIGGSRFQILRQHVIEILPAALAGCGLGIVLAYGASPLLLRLLPVLHENGAQFAVAPRPAIEMDLRVALFSICAALGTVVAVGSVPGAFAARLNLNEELRLQSRMVFGRRVSAGQALLFLQVALTMLLLTAAALMARSYSDLQHVDPGFDRAHVILFRIDPQSAGYQSARLKPFYEQMQQRVRNLPQIRAADGREGN